LEHPVNSKNALNPTPCRKLSPELSSTNTIARSASVSSPTLPSPLPLPPPPPQPPLPPATNRARTRFDCKNRSHENTETSNATRAFESTVVVVLLLLLGVTAFLRIPPPLSTISLFFVSFVPRKRREREREREREMRVLKRFDKCRRNEKYELLFSSRMHTPKQKGSDGCASTLGDKFFFKKKELLTCVYTHAHVSLRAHSRQQFLATQNKTNDFFTRNPLHKVIKAYTRACKKRAIALKKINPRRE